MKILMLSWEYPPRIIGGLARHVHDLSVALVQQGHEVEVITGDHVERSELDIMDGVRVHRLKMYSPQPLDFLDSVFQFNLDMMERVVGLREKGVDFDIIHAHDWLVAYGAKALKHAYRRPLLATVHATEYGRNHGLHNPLQRYISSVEWWLAYEAWHVICCSDYMYNELHQFLQVPEDKLSVIPNGVNREDFQPSAPDAAEFRRQYAAPDEKMVFFIGRLVTEKGVGVLIEAVPIILSRYPNCKFVIAGKGPAADYLKRRARELGVYERIYFTGFIGDDVRNNLYHVADVAVFPSLYEPFGIVALEAMAAQVPVVVSNVGGFAEIIQHGKNGLQALPGNHESLADNILALLLAPGLAAKLKERAYGEVVQEYNWPRIARKTGEIYEKVLDEYENTPWEGPFTPPQMEGQLLLSRVASFFSRHRGRYQSTGENLLEQLLKK